MSDISFEFIEKSTTKVTEKCYIAVLMVPSSECSNFGEGELYRSYSDFESVEEDFEATTNAYKMANDWFLNNKNPLIIASKSASTYKDSLTALCEKNDWFGFVMITSTTDEDILEVAEWCENKKKIFLALTSDTENVLDGTKTTDICSKLIEKKYKYTGISLFNSTTHEQNNLNCVAMSKVIGKEPGSYDVCNKGEDWTNVYPDDYTSNQKNNVLPNKRCNFYYVDRNTGYERNNYKYGVMVNGDSLFQRRNIMWFEDEIMTRSYNLLFSQDVILRSEKTKLLLQKMLNDLFTEALTNNVCQFAEKSLFAELMGVDESEVKNYSPNGYILNLPDIMDNDNWESTGNGQFKYKNIVFDVVFNGTINQFKGTIILRKM